MHNHKNSIFARLLNSKSSRVVKMVFHMCSVIYSLYTENLQEDIHYPSLVKNNLIEISFHRGYFHGIFQTILIMLWNVISDVFTIK